MSDAPLTVCGMCAKPGFATIEGLAGAPITICIDHYVQLQSVENEKKRNLADQARQAMAMINLAAAEMDLVTGVPLSPRVDIPGPAPAGTYTTISVQNSTIGVLSTAVVGQIVSTIGAMPDGDATRVALEDMTKLVAEERALAEQERKDLLDQIASVAEQAAATSKERRPAVVRSLLVTIGQAASSVTALAAAWKAVEPILRGHFGL